MTGTCPQLTEVAGGAHNAGPEMMLPDAIDHDPGRQRILGTGNRLGQFQSATSPSKRNRFTLAQGGQKTPWGFFPQGFTVAADMNPRISRFGGILDGVKKRIGR